MLSKRLIEVLVLCSIQTAEVSREMTMKMVPSLLEQSPLEDKNDLTIRDVGNSGESIGDLVPEIVREMDASDSLEEPTRVETIDIASFCQRSAAMTISDKKRKRNRSSKKGGLRGMFLDFERGERERYYKFLVIVRIRILVADPDVFFSSEKEFRIASLF